MKKNKSKNRKKAPPYFRPLSRSRAIVLSDGTLLREKTLNEISLLREIIAKNELEIEEHVTRSEPEFRAWLHQEFKDLIEKSKKLLDSISEKESVFMQVEELMYQEDLHPGEAYELVSNPAAMAEFQKRLEAKAKRQEKKAKAKGFDDFNPFGPGPGQDEEDFMEQMAEEFEKMFGFKAPFERATSPPEAASHSRSDRSDDLEVKRAYREIVKQLHPDRATLWSANEKALWNQAQQAYHHGDLDGLREVLTALGSGATILPENDRLGDLLARLQKLKREFMERQRDLGRHQQSPAWKFSFKNIKGLLKIRKRSESEIQSEYRHLRSKMEDLQEDWEDLMDDHRRWKMRSEFNRQHKLSSPKKRCL